MKIEVSYFMVNKELLEIPLSDLGLNDPLHDRVTYQYYKG